MHIKFQIHTVKSMSLINQHSYFMDNSAPENDMADIIVSKGYLPNERDLPKTSIVKNVGKYLDNEDYNCLRRY